MNEWGFVQKIKTFEQGRIIFSYAKGTQAILPVWKKIQWTVNVLVFWLCQKVLTMHIFINTRMYYTLSIHKCLLAGICYSREQRFVWRSVLCVVMVEGVYIVERLGKEQRAETQRGVGLAVTEKMRIWRQGDKEFKQNEACRLAALPSVTGVISWGSLSLCLLPLFI